MDEQLLHRITELTVKHANKTLTPAETAELEAWLDKDPLNRERFEARLNEAHMLEALAFEEEGEQRKAAAYRKLEKRLQPVRRRRYVSFRFRLVAAAAIVIMMVSTWLIIPHNQTVTPSVPSSGSTKQPVVVLPGGNRAFLELSDGRKLDLTKVANGQLAEQAGAQVIKLADGQVAYRPSPATSGAVVYNKVSTPRGGNYRVLLPDGSEAWLNALSSIRYATSFNGPERNVEVTGEVYFEVAKDRAKPFVVTSGGVSVRVYGTHFNIRAYDNEQAVTLLEGAVQVRRAGQAIMLRPGQQVVTADELRVNEVDTTGVVAWKNGFFEWNKADIVTIMDEVSRWYDVMVVYQVERPKSRLTARISRQKNAADVLEILQASGYHFSITNDGKTILVKP